MEMQTGKLAAKRQTWRAKTVRELYAEIRASNPSASEAVRRRAFRDAVRDDNDYFLAVVDYAFDAAERAFEERSVRSISAPISARERADRAVVVAQRAQQHAEAVAYIKEQIILLNQEQPNGKRLRFCTEDYMFRLGGVWRKVGKSGSRKLIGEVYTEDQLREKLKGLA